MENILSYINPEQLPPLVSWQQNAFRGIIFTDSHEQELNKIEWTKPGAFAPRKSPAAEGAHRLLLLNVL